MKDTATQGYNLSITVNGFNLSYDDLGEGDMPILFLHGYPFDKSMWKGQLEHLKASHRVLACDIRGFGRSTDETTPLSMGLFADDLIAFMDQLNIEKAILCGLSMGGFIALNAVSRFTDRFEALVLADTQCIADTNEVLEKRAEALVDIASNGSTPFREKFIQTVFHPESLETKKDVVLRLREVVFTNSTHIITMGLKALADRSETCSILDQISQPTLILCGRADEVTPLAQSEMMYNKIQPSVLHVIEKAGHVSNLEQPDEFNKHLLEFISAIGDANFEKINGRKRMV